MHRGRRFARWHAQRRPRTLILVEPAAGMQMQLLVTGQSVSVPGFTMHRSQGRMIVGEVVASTPAEQAGLHGATLSCRLKIGELPKRPRSIPVRPWSHLRAGRSPWRAQRALFLQRATESAIGRAVIARFGANA